MTIAYSQTIDHILVALSDVKSDVEATIYDLIRQNQELVDEKRDLEAAVDRAYAEGFNDGLLVGRDKQDGEA